MFDFLNIVCFSENDFVMSCWVGDNDTSSISAIETLSADFGELLKTGDDISDVTFVVDGKVKFPNF